MSWTRETCCACGGLLSVVGTPALRQAAPAAVGLVLGVFIGNLLGARRTARVYQEAVKLLSHGLLYPPQGSSGFKKGWRR